MLVARIKGAVAAEEVRKNSQRRIRANQSYAEDGKAHGGGYRAFGWQRGKGIKDGTEIDETEAALLREAAQRILDGGTLRSIRDEWIEKGVPTPGGKHWHTRSIKNALCSPRNAGLREYKGKIMSEATWPAILDRETHERLVAILTHPTRRTNVTTTIRSYPLSGFVVCGKCDTGLVGKPLLRPRKNDPRRKRRFYICTADRGGCGHLSIDAERVEEVVLPKVLRMVDDPRAHGNMADADDASAEEMRRLTLEKAEARQKLKGYETWLL